MNINLIKIDTHNNKLALYKEYFGEEIFFTKQSLEFNSNKIIEVEINGYEWFFSKILKKENPVEIKRGVFNEIRMPQFIGEQFYKENKFHLKRNNMEQIVNFYINNWPINNDFAIHGDMGLSNFIFGNKLYIIDWEHFHKSNLCYYGFDIINMIFISFHYRFNNSLILPKKDKSFIRMLYKMLFKKIDFESLIKKRPFIETKKYILKNYEMYNNKLDLRKKFIITAFSDKALNDLDNYVTN